MYNYIADINLETKIFGYDLRDEKSDINLETKLFGYDLRDETSFE